MTDYEIDIREIKDTLKKMQEDIKRLEDNLLFTHNMVNVDEIADEIVDEIPPSTQACSLEDMERYVI